LTSFKKFSNKTKAKKNDHFLADAALNALNKKTFKQSREKQEKDVEREIALALIDDISKPEMLIEKNLLLSAVRSNDKEICQKILEKTKNQNSLCAGMIGLEHTESPEMYHFLKSHLTGEMRPPIGYLMERLIEKTDKSPLFDCLLEDADDGDKINVCIKAAQFKKWDLVQFIWDEVSDKELWGKQEIVSWAIRHSNIKMAKFVMDDDRFGPKTFLPNADLFLSRENGYQKTALDFVLSYTEKDTVLAGILGKSLRQKDPDFFNDVLSWSAKNSQTVDYSSALYIVREAMLSKILNEERSALLINYPTPKHVAKAILEFQKNNHHLNDSLRKDGAVFLKVAAVLIEREELFLEVQKNDQPKSRVRKF